MSVTRHQPQQRFSATLPGSPKPSRVTASHFSRRSAAGFQKADDRHVSRRAIPVSPFVVAWSPGATRFTANESPLPCREHRSCLWPCRRQVEHLPHKHDFYSGHTPSLRHFSHLADLRGTGHDTGRHRPSRVSSELHSTSHVAIGCDSEDTIAGCVALPREHRLPKQFPSLTARAVSERRFGFQGTERRSIPLPIGDGCSRFGTVSR